MLISNCKLIYDKQDNYFCFIYTLRLTWNICRFNVMTTRGYMYIILKGAFSLKFYGVKVTNHENVNGQLSKDSVRMINEVAVPLHNFFFI